MQIFATLEGKKISRTCEGQYHYYYSIGNSRIVVFQDQRSKSYHKCIIALLRSVSSSLFPSTAYITTLKQLEGGLMKLCNKNIRPLFFFHSAVNTGNKSYVFEFHWVRNQFQCVRDCRIRLFRHCQTCRTKLLQENVAPCDAAKRKKFFRFVTSLRATYRDIVKKRLPWSHVVLSWSWMFKATN